MQENSIMKQSNITQTLYRRAEVHFEDYCRTFTGFSCLPKQ